MSDEHAAVRLERMIPAPLDQVYRAWLEPELLRRWLAPGGLEVERMDVDERVGGHLRVWQTDSGTPVGGFDCQLLELVPDQRIVFRWGFVGPDRNDGPRFDSLLTITLHEASPGVTALTLVHERLEPLRQAMPNVADSVSGGWEDVLTKLASMLQDATR